MIRRWGLGIAACLLAARVVVTTAAPAPSPDAAAIVDRVDRLLRGDSSEGEMTMADVTRRWTRTLSITVWSEGTEKALIEVTAPPKEAGTATLSSALLLPHGEWSLSNSLGVVLGGIFGVGPGLRSDGRPGSEYGAAPATVYGAVKVSF